MLHPDNTEQSVIEQEVRARRWMLGFAGTLEADFRRDHRQRAVQAFQHSSVFILLLYTLLSTGIYMLLPADAVGRWWSLYAWVGVIVIVAGVFSRQAWLDDWFEVYAGLGSFAAVALSVLITGLVPGQLTHVAIMYATIIIYSVVGLRFRQAVYAGWGGGAVGAALILLLGGQVDWELLHRSYTGSSLLGMFIAYYAERRDRELYLQTRLLQLSQERTEEYAGKLDRLARQDALTGLANRRHFDEILQQEWRRAARQQSTLAVLMIDIDHFKHYNDGLGHVHGDACLRQVASLISARARRPGELAVRYGGEEFLLLFPETGRDEACKHAQHLLDAFHDAHIPQAAGLSRAAVTVSVGVAVAVPGVSMLAPGELICAADDALYEAKHAGRDTWRFAAGLSAAAPATPATTATTTSARV